MVINTNVSAQSSARLLADSSDRLSKSLARLSSGSKIVSPEDDAAGVAVSLRFDAQLNRTSAAINNLNNAVSYIQTQDGFLQKVGKALDRMSELSMLSQDSTKTDSDRDLYQQEFVQLQSYVQEVSAKQFNGVSLFSSDATMTITTDSEGYTIAVSGIELSNSATSVGVAISTTSTSITSTELAASALVNVQKAITELAKDRALVGASIVRLSSTSGHLGVLKDNLAAANSRIKDVDVADESTQFARYNILVQAGTAMLAQANSSPQSALRLLS